MGTEEKTYPGGCLTCGGDVISLSRGKDGICAKCGPVAFDVVRRNGQSVEGFSARTWPEAGYTEDEIEARRALVSLVQAMIAGELPFLEGAIAVLGLEHAVGGVNWPDADFMAFTAVASETDYLPRAEQRSFWAPDALSRLEPEIKQKEEWARSFAMDACKNLLDRFNNS